MKSDRKNTIITVLLAISVVHFLNDMMQAVIPSIYPIIKSQYGFTFGQIGIITLVFQITSCVLQPFVGRYTDRNPMPYSLCVGMAFSFIGILLLAVAQSFALILLSVSIIGWGSAVFHPGASQVVQLITKGRKGLAQAIFQVGGSGGNAIGPLLVALIVIPFGQPAIAWFAIVAGIAFIILLKIGHWYKFRLSIRLENSIASDKYVTNGLTDKDIRRAFRILILLLISKYFFLSSVTNYFTFFLIDKFEVSVKTSQLFLFAFLISSAIGTVVGVWLGDKIGRKYIIWGSILGAAPFTLLLPYAGIEWTLLLIIVIGLIISSAFSSIIVYAIDLRPDKVGTISGIFFGLSSGIAGILAAFFGWLADMTSIEFVFHVSTVFPLLGIVAYKLPDLKKLSINHISKQ